MKLALGTVQFGLDYGIANRSGQVAQETVPAILAMARKSGLDTLDTAIAYGTSEERLGQASPLDGWHIVTKLPAFPDGCEDVATWVRKEIAGSLRRLRMDQLYGVLLHRPIQLLGPQGAQLQRALDALVGDGLVEKTGISVYDPSELDEICSRFPVGLVQAPFNVLDRRLIDSGWLGRLSERRIELHVRSAFLQGLLLMEPAARPPAFRRWQEVFVRWDAAVAQSGATRLQLCLAHALSFPEISKVVVGVDDAAQLADILRAAESGADVDVLRDVRTDELDLLDPGRWPRS